MRDKRKQGSNPAKDPVVKHFTPASQSRRDFLEGTGATVVATAAVSALGLSATSAAQAQSARLLRSTVPITPFRS